MADTDAKRGKIDELLEYIESCLEELEEKEELKEFQEHKQRGCVEYAMHQRKLEVGEALGEIENERRLEVHGANERRGKEIQVCRVSSF